MGMAPMNPEAEARFISILEKDVNDLTENDIRFLRARRPYIGKRSMKRLQHILDAEPVELKDEKKKDEVQEPVMQGTSAHPADNTASEDADGEDEE